MCRSGAGLLGCQVGGGAAPEDLGLGLPQRLHFFGAFFLPGGGSLHVPAGGPWCGRRGRDGAWSGLEAHGCQKAGSVEGHGQVRVGSRQSAGLMGSVPLSLRSLELVVNI